MESTEAITANAALRPQIRRARRSEPFSVAAGTKTKNANNPVTFAANRGYGGGA